MNKYTSQPHIQLGLIVILLVTLSSCIPGSKEYGSIEGQVNIGPLQPAVQVGVEQPTPHPEVYAAREIVVYKKNGKTEFTRLGIDPTGRYHGKLPVGVYVIDINRLGIDSADNLPMKITITADRIFTLDINIDTGIR